MVREMGTIGRNMKKITEEQLRKIIRQQIVEVKSMLNKGRPTSKELMNKYGDDPLYSDVIDAVKKNSMKDFKKAVDTLKKIRGNTAYRNFINELKGQLNEASPSTIEVEIPLNRNVDAIIRDMKKIAKSGLGKFKGSEPYKNVEIATFWFHYPEAAKEFARVVDETFGRDVSYISSPQFK